MIQTILQKDSAVIQILSDHLDMYNTPELRDLITKQIGAQALTVILDLEKVQRIDSSAIGFLIYLQKTVKDQNGKVILVNFTEPVFKVMRTIRALDIFTYYGNTNEALNALQISAA